MSNRYHEEVVWDCNENPATEGYVEKFYPTKRDLAKEFCNLGDLMADIKNSLDRIDKAIAECEEILERK